MPYKNPHSKEAKENAKKRYKKYKNIHREEINKRERERIKNDPEYRTRRINHAKKYQRENRDKVLLYKKKHNLEKLYGIKWEQYQVLLENQNGGCAICGGKNMSNRKLAVDHCHKTKKNRGLLCDNCNRGLGFFKENIKLLFKAINYLKLWEDHQ